MSGERMTRPAAISAAATGDDDQAPKTVPVKWDVGCGEE